MKLKLKLNFNLKIYSYLITALLISSLLSTLIFTVISIGALNELREAIMEYQLVNNELALENDELQDTIAMLEKLEANPTEAEQMQVGSDSSQTQADYLDNKESTVTKLDLKTAFLTFNGGPSSSTGKILDILSKHNVKATFFVVGKTSPADQAMYKRIVEEGHAIGNLTYSHDFFQVYSSEESFTEDFNKLQKLVFEVTGVTPSIYRFPGGTEQARKLFQSQFLKRISDKMAEDGYTVVDWNVDSRDASSYSITKEQVIEAVLSQSENKEEAIILLHDSTEKAAGLQALPDIIKGLTEMGYVFEAIENKFATENM